MPRIDTRISRRTFTQLVGLGGITLAGSVFAGSMLAGCTNSRGARQGETSAADGSAGSSVEVTPSDALTDTPESSAKVLVAVFSWSGNTLKVAEYIHKNVESDFFRIEPAESYTTVYDDVLDVAQAEKNSDSRPALAAHVENLDDYAIVYLDFPVWWYQEPQIVRSFLDAHDLSGKEVRPFSTSGGSSNSQGLDNLRQLYPNVELGEGITFPGSSVDAHLDEVTEWIG